MKKITLVILFTLLTANLSMAQWSGYSHTTGGSELDAGLGMTWIDNQAYYTITFQPDISIGKLGIGLGINILYNPDEGKVRSVDWDSGYDYARIIRYIRYGYKGDKVYAKIGALDGARIGHGFIMNFYNNQVKYDERKLGLVFDVDLGKFGFESMTNNLGRLEVIGGRGYYRPIYNSNIPVLKNIAFGVSYVTDTNIPPHKVNFTNDTIAYQDKVDNVSVWGVDFEMPLIKSKILTTMLYADHAQIINYGHGQAVGLGTDFSALWGFLELSFNIERRFLGKEFMGTYFGPFYEMFRSTAVDDMLDFYYTLGGDSADVPVGFETDLANIPVNQKVILPMMRQKRRGWYGSLIMDFFNLVNVLGSFQVIDNTDNSGILHIGAGLSQSIPVLAFEASYDKRNLGKLKDVFTLDNRSIARVGIGYKLKPYLLLYMDYIWNFIWDEDDGEYKPSKRIQPRLSFRYPF